MKKREVLSMFVFILLLATITFMFSNSLEPVAISKAKSLNVMEHIAPLLELFVGKGDVTDHIVRKIAHFTEFVVLGIGLMMFAVLRFRTRLQNVVNCMSFGLATAVADESLQMLTNRGPLVKDVLLDFSGVFSGVLFVLLIHTIVESVRKNSKNNKRRQTL